jgi:hypothetical protein
VGNIGIEQDGGLSARTNRQCRRSRCKDARVSILLARLIDVDKRTVIKRPHQLAITAAELGLLDLSKCARQQVRAVKSQMGLTI